jgi:peptidoglycan/LPS O-acetylase OafA/YrhL
MLLSAALFALFLTGCWLYCLTDAILTPAPECRGLSKQAWVAVIAVTFIVGALAWLVVRRPARDSARPVTAIPPWCPDAFEITDHLTVSQGPDDDPEFLDALKRAIRRNPPVS